MKALRNSPPLVLGVLHCLSQRSILSDGTLVAWNPPRAAAPAALRTLQITSPRNNAPKPAVICVAGCARVLYI